MKNISQKDMILISIYKLSNGTTNRIPFEEIVIKVWEDFPDTFSLRDHPIYPDSYIVSKRLYTDLITDRFVVSLKNQIYKLSEKGINRAKEIMGKGQDLQGKERYINLSWNEKQFLDHAIKSRTFQSWFNDNPVEIIDYDARVFFQFSTGTPINERIKKREFVKETIDKAIGLSIEQSEDLQKLTSFLCKKFYALFEE